MENLSPREIFFNLLKLGVLFGVLYAITQFINIDDLRAQIENAGVWAPLVLILAKASTIVIAPLSGSPIYPIAGALFGFWQGTLYLVLGDMLGAATAFILVRIFGASLVRRMIGADTGLLKRALTMMSTVRGFFIARLCFLTFPELPAFAAGLTAIRFLPFILIQTAVGIVPTMIMAAIGSLLTPENTGLVFGLMLLAGGTISTVSMLIFYRLISVDTSAETSHTNAR